MYEKHLIEFLVKSSDNIKWCPGPNCVEENAIIFKEVIS